MDLTLHLNPPPTEWGEVRRGALYGIGLKEAEKIIARYGESPYRARQLVEWLYHRHVEDWQGVSNLPKSLLGKLKREFLLKSLTLKESVKSHAGQSVKFLFETQDHHLLESVLIRQQGRETVCVSTQLGCKMKCVFCASGRSFNRSLMAGEIVEQVVWVEKNLGKRVSNVVFMGMGEPLDNFEATMKALEILQADWGFRLGAKRITVSTVGLTPRIEEFVKRMGGRVRLSISLHASDEKKRNELVPINRRYSLRGLVRTLTKIHERLKREITFEYTLLEGVNDTPEEARGVVTIAKPLRAKVNLIPYNPIREESFKRPSRERVENFREILLKAGIRVTVRQTAGRDIDAACGQLRLDREGID
ncbi:MAG: 23S rRNA (adenine(2503)-C(2))-methyltransferase RlmN [Candidatus Omnitrophica bacterium]|nr:23S rRNA (adenine(2503)-C(2))-methyltransferase RlmN [Candidatus Omnitrophota bacterium]